MFYIEPLVNRSINVCAQFENSGEIAVTARFKGEVYCDGAFVDVIESEEKPVAVGETLSPLATRADTRRVSDTRVSAV